MVLKSITDTPLKISTLISLVGVVITLITGAIAFDSRYVKSNDFEELKNLRIQDVQEQAKSRKYLENRVDAMFYGYEMRALRDRVLYLQDKVETGEAGTADRRDLRRLETRLHEMENKDWPNMADRFTQ